MAKYLHILLTGNGKGKTTSAIGQAIRAAGHGQKVVFVQCVKQRECGEHKALQRFSDCIDLKQVGAGFTDRGDPMAHQKMAQEAWREIQNALVRPYVDWVMLDEFHHLLHKGYIPADEVQLVLQSRTKDRHLLTTGRHAPQWLIEMADTVSIIESCKHHYSNHILAQKGVEL